MNDEQILLERLRLVEALHAGAATPGERDAAANARDRIRNRLKSFEVADPPIEYSFPLGNHWSRKLFVALLRRYDIRPYRYPRQRHTTVMARISRKFLDETLWPQFLELDKSLTSYLNDMTDRVIKQAINSDSSEAEVRPEPAKLPGVS